MMYIKSEKCNGCGVCLEVCPVEAIFMESGKAAIDRDTCLACGNCIQVCPEGAISELELPVPVTTTAIQPVNMQTARPVLAPRSVNQLAWARPVLSFIGHEIVPRLADALVAALDRRLSASSTNRATVNLGTEKQQFRRRGVGRGGTGLGHGRGNKPGSGPGGNCLCPKCGHRIPHQAGQRCLDIACPQCGTKMVRD